VVLPCNLLTKILASVKHFVHPTNIIQASYIIYTSLSVYTIQAQYVFIHDALDELITCGETDIPAAGLRVKVNHLKKTIPGSGITGFARQFKVCLGLSEQC